jgi:uncharacterized protein with PQ loop repeat
MEFIGWIGAICFSVCGVPQALMAYKNKHANGLSDSFLWLWWTGELATLIYTIPLEALPLIVNYLFNIMCINIIIFYKYFGKNRIK